MRVGLVIEGGTGAQGVGGAIHTAGGAEGVGVAAGCTPGTAFLKMQASITAAKRKFITLKSGKHTPNQGSAHRQWCSM